MEGLGERELLIALYDCFWTVVHEDCIKQKESGLLSNRCIDVREI